jgi:hypothetical protein
LCADDNQDEVIDEIGHHSVAKLRCRNEEEQMLPWIAPVLLSKSNSMDSTCTNNCDHRVHGSRPTMSIRSINHMYTTPEYIVLHVVQQITDPTSDIDVSVGQKSADIILFPSITELIHALPFLFFPGMVI